MCGIAGRIMNGSGNIGRDLVNLMQAQSHRGEDSTGFAVYGNPKEKGYVLRGMGFDKSRLSSDMENFRLILKEHHADFTSEPKFVEDSNKHYCVRLEISDPQSVAEWIKDADTISKDFEIQSCGRSLEIIKDIGSSEEVAEKHGVNDMVGTHGLGHARLATESSVLPNASHPFWARPFPDTAIVHNGQITNYFTWREKLERKGYRFLTENDSELIAVWVSDQQQQGLSMEEALKNSIREIDGVFTYMIAQADRISFAKDRFAIKPIVSIESNGEFLAATEEQALRKVKPEITEVINYDGPSQTKIWSIGVE